MNAHKMYTLFLHYMNAKIMFFFSQPLSLVLAHFGFGRKREKKIKMNVLQTEKKGANDVGAAIWLANNKWRCSKMDSENIIYSVHTWIPNAVTSKLFNVQNGKKRMRCKTDGATENMRSRNFWVTAHRIDGHRYLSVAFTNIDSQ